MGTANDTDEVKQDAVTCRVRTAAEDETRRRPRNLGIFTSTGERRRPARMIQRATCRKNIEASLSWFLINGTKKILVKHLDHKVDLQHNIYYSHKKRYITPPALTLLIYKRPYFSKLADTHTKKSG